MRMTSKGQVTVPKEFREILGVGPGSEIGFEEQSGKVMMFADDNRPDPREDFRRRLARVQELARKAKKIPMTDKELMELTRGPFNDLDPA
jgi:AbrB family looped-hinge helix DNA binding protein